MRIALLAAIGLLYLVSIPWYRETGEAPSMWLGLPDWVAVAVVCYAAAAVLNAAAWLLTDIPESEPGDSKAGALEAEKLEAGERETGETAERGAEQDAPSRSEAGERAR